MYAYMYIYIYVGSPISAPEVFYKHQSRNPKSLFGESGTWQLSLNVPQLGFSLLPHFIPPVSPANPNPKP